MGPWIKLINFFGGEVGSSLGKRVLKDSRQAADTLFDGSKFVWTHKNKIKELAEDSGLSGSYVKELAEKSTSKDDISEVIEYLASNRSNNLDRETRVDIIRALKSKLQYIEDQEALREIIKAYKAKGLSMAEHVMNYLA